MKKTFFMLNLLMNFANFINKTQIFGAIFLPRAAEMTSVLVKNFKMTTIVYSQNMFPAYYG